MPQATLAAVVIVYSIGLIRPAEFQVILGVRRTEFTWALAALIGVVPLGTLKESLSRSFCRLSRLASQVADPPVYLLGRKPGTNAFRARTREHPEDGSAGRRIVSTNHGTQALAGIYKKISCIAFSIVL